MQQLTYDIAIIGAGIAGASLAAELGPSVSVVILEMEDAPGYHSTGRSASFWDECYGGPLVQPLTRASFDLLFSPPPEFSESSFLKQRGVLYLAQDEDRSELQAFADQFGDQVSLQSLDRAGVAVRVPGLLPQWTSGIFAADCSDIDVAALHAAYLGKARRHGVTIRCRARVDDLARDGGEWQILAGGAPIRARTLVNAAGAWADQVADLAGVPALGITPYRRTIAQLRVAPAAASDLPLVIDVNGSFYFKPDAGGRLWLSPHDETPSTACDAAAEDLDIAVAIDRLSRVTDWQVEAVESSWAGLRSFAPDRLPVYGFDPHVSGFFWCAGQGGFGIQTAPAAAKMCASLLMGTPMDQGLRGIQPGRYAPARLRN